MCHSEKNSSPLITATRRQLGDKQLLWTSLILGYAQIASITVDDANGSPVSGATVSSLAGVDYTLPPQTATPEPSSFILLGTGIIAVMAQCVENPEIGEAHPRSVPVAFVR